MQQTSRLQEALIVFHKWCESKSINPKSFLSSEQTDGNDVGTRTTYSTDYSADAYNVFESFHKELKDGLDAAKEVSKGLVQESPELDVNMSFKEVYDKKNKTAVERKLVEAVEVHLSPQEKENAKTNPSFKVSDVITQVNQSIQKSQELAMNLFRIEEKKEKETKQEAEKTHEKPEKKMESLGQEFGVLDEIVKSMRKVLDEKQPEQQKTQDKQRKPSFETVALSSVSSSSIPTAEGHSQAKGQGRGVQ
jgi:hypothetical protein